MAVKVQFRKPTLNFARGDVVVLEEDYVEKVVKKYINKHFDAGEDRDRFDVLERNVDEKTDSRSKSTAQRATEEEEEGAQVTGERSFNQLKADAEELGIDTKGLNSKAKLSEAIKEATGEQ